MIIFQKSVRRIKLVLLNFYHGDLEEQGLLSNEVEINCLRYIMRTLVKMIYARE